MSKELFKEAIADAKAVREAALANAKAALEEALTPKLQSMLAAKLNEMEYEEEELEETKKSEEEKMEEGMYPEDTSDEIQDRYRATGAALEENEELEEDFDLSEILAELNESDDKDADDVKEAKEKEEAGEEAEGESEEEEATEEEPTEEEGEEVEVKDMTIEDLKDLIKDIVSQEMGDEAPEMGAEEPMSMGSEEATAETDEIDLEELLAELDSLDESEELEEAKKKKDKEDKKEKMDEGIFNDLGNKLSAWAYDTDLDTIKSCKDSTKGKGIAAFQDCLKSKGVKMSTIGTEPGASAMGGNWKQFGKTTGEFKEELEEAIETINTLRTELNETNLLNAKLLYVNKLFKAKNLTESQKLKVIASFDKATNVKEAKVVFESLEAAINAPAKKAIKESLGFASKAVGNAPNKVIVESNDVIARMQKLANIK